MIGPWWPDLHMMGLRSRVRVSVEWRPRDCCVGVYWEHRGGPWSLHVWLLIVPMFPIHINWRTR